MPFFSKAKTNNAMPHESKARLFNYILSSEETKNYRRYVIEVVVKNVLFSICAGDVGRRHIWGSSEVMLSGEYIHIRYTPSQGQGPPWNLLIDTPRGGKDLLGSESGFEIVLSEFIDNVYTNINEWTGRIVDKGIV